MDLYEMLMNVKLFDMDMEQRYHEDPVSVIKEELKKAGKEKFSKPAIIEYLARTMLFYEQLQDQLKMIEFDIDENGEIRFMDTRANDGRYPIYNCYVYVNEDGVVTCISNSTDKYKRRINEGYPICSYAFDRSDDNPVYSSDNGDILFGACGGDIKGTFSETYEYYTARYPELKKWYKNYYGVDEENIYEYSCNNGDNFTAYIHEIERNGKKNGESVQKTDANSKSEQEKGNNSDGKISLNGIKDAINKNSQELE